MKLRSRIFTLIYFGTGIVWGCLCVLTWLLPQSGRHRFVVWWTQFAIWWLKVSCNIDYKIIGLENFNKSKKPIVILSKHQSTWETLFLQGLCFPVCTVVKKELLRIPFFGWGLSAVKPIPIDRTDPIKALKKVKQGGVNRLEQGLNVLLFPEGTRVEPGEKNKYARSGADIAIQAGVDIIPIAHNAGQFWPTSSSVKKSGTIKLSIGEPRTTKNRSSKEIMSDIETWIEAEVARLLEE